MDKLLINGGVPLTGEVHISGAKNAALPLMCAALLSPEPLTLTNVPRLSDVSTMLKLIGRVGVKVVREQVNGNDRVQLHAAGITEAVADYDLVKTMRASIMVLGPLVAR